MPQLMPEAETEAARESIIEAVERINLNDTPAWNDLDILSNNTQIDGIEVDPAGIVFESSAKFRGIMNVYVVLRYITNREEAFESSEAFIGRFRGHLNSDGQASIDEVSVDTSPFYEGEAMR